MAGLHVSKLKLEDMRMVVFGSGTAGTGIADQVRDAIAADSNKSKEDAAKQIWSVSSLPNTSSKSIPLTIQVRRQTWPPPPKPRRQTHTRPNPLRAHRFRMGEQRPLRPPLRNPRSETPCPDRHLHETKILHQRNHPRDVLARRSPHRLPPE